MWVIAVPPNSCSDTEASRLLLLIQTRFIRPQWFNDIEIIRSRSPYQSKIIRTEPRSAIRLFLEGPLLADSTSTRGCPKAAARVISTRSRNPWLDFSLFRNFQRVIHLDAEVSDRTFQFGMAKQ